MEVKTKTEFSEDYIKAQNIVSSLKLYSDTILEVTNKGAFRKYLYDLGRFESKAYTTRTIDLNSLRIVRIK